MFFTTATCHATRQARHGHATWRYRCAICAAARFATPFRPRRDAAPMRSFCRRFIAAAAA
jgi:hypothetical protein